MANDYVKTNDIGYCQNIINNPPVAKKPSEGKDACIELQEKIAKINADTDLSKSIAEGTLQAINSLNPFNIIDKAINGSPSKSEAKSMVTTSLTKEMNKLSSINVSNKCLNITENTQINSLMDAPECILVKNARYDSLCGIFKDIDSKVKCIAEVTKEFAISNLTQENKINANKTCKLNSIIEETSKVTTDTTIQALLSVMQKSSGGVSTSNNVSCSAIKETISEETYKNAQSCCLNKSTNNQKNEILCKGGINIKQANELNDVSNCMMKLGIMTNTEIKSTTANKTDVANTQDTQAPPGILANIKYIILAFVLLIVVGGIVWWVVTSKKSPDNTDDADDTTDDTLEDT